MPPIRLQRHAFHHHPRATLTLWLFLLALTATLLYFPHFARPSAITIPLAITQLLALLGRPYAAKATQAILFLFGTLHFASFAAIAYGSISPSTSVSLRLPLQALLSSIAALLLSELNAHWQTILLNYRLYITAVPTTLCPHCRYDLRSTPDPSSPPLPVCPECGGAS